MPEAVAMISWRSQLSEALRPAAADEVMALHVQHALSIVGLEAGEPATRKRFEELLGPSALGERWDLDRPFRCWFDPGSQRWRTEGVSTCGLVREGILRRMGVAFPALYAPYDPKRDVERAIARTEAFARSYKAWQQPVPGSGLRPGPGCGLVIGEGLGTHVCIVVAWEDEVCVSVDGGQLGRAGLQAVHVCRRMWLERGGVPYLGGRKVWGWDEPALLPYTGRCLVPQDDGA